MKILVADDELVSRDKLQKILEPYGTVEGFEDGTAAIEAFQKAWAGGIPYDLLMLDVIMPGLGGTQALQVIRQIEKRESYSKKAQVFIVSSKSDRSTIIAAVQAGCNGFVVKPFNPEIIAQKLKEIGVEPQSSGNDDVTGRDRIRREVLNIIDRFKRGDIELPIMPDVVHEVQELISKPESTVNDLSHTIEKDAVISARLIAIANSPNYRGSGKVQTVSQAIGRLGFKEAQNVTMAVANQMFYKTKNKKLLSTMEKMRLYSLASAYGASQIAARLELSDTDKYFLMGLIHDIGNVLLLWMLGGIALEDDSLSMDELILETDKLHQSFGAVLLERWKFPEDIINVVRMHEGPSFDTSTPKEVLIVSLAGNMAFTVGYGFYEREPLELSELDATKLLQISPDTLEFVKVAVQDAMEKSSDLV